MRIRSFVYGALGLAACGLLAAVSGAARTAQAAPGHDPLPSSLGVGTPVLVELFTSEGCSSCPPADAVAARLVQSQPVTGAHIIVLAHHVDYWNQLGWEDPFSGPAATARQRAYAPIARSNYTPQAVIDGHVEMAGSRGAEIELAVATAAKAAHAKVDLVVTSSSKRDALNVAARVGALPPEAKADAELIVAVVQNRGRVDVPRGENAGHTLEHSSISRSLRTIGSVPMAGGASQTVLDLPASVAAPGGSTFSVVAFVQERASRRVLGAASASLTSR